MKKVYILVIGLFLMSFTGTVQHEEWLIKSDSTLLVHGKTNVNSFSCGIPGFTKKNYLSYSVVENGKVNFHQTCEIVIDVTGFKCHNPLMTKDLLKTIKAEENPVMKIKFLSMSIPLSLASNKAPISSKALISLAGETSTYKIDLYPSDVCPGTMTLKGSKQICFADFGMVAPTKMGGMVKVNDYLDVDFTFVLNKVN